MTATSEIPKRADAGLVLASWVYLALPVGVFLACWVRPEFGLLAVALLVLGLWQSARPLLGEQKDKLDRTWLTVAGVAFVAVALSGAGGIGLQNWDYNKHNAVLRDLISNPWPLRYSPVDAPDLNGPFVYYHAWYLLPALIGKAAGWPAANLALFAWTWLGVSLGLGWFVRLAGGRVWVALFFALAFSGLDVVGALISGRNPIRMANLDLHWWAGFAQFAHPLALINWVPHHAIPIWIGTGLILREAWSNGSRERMLVAGALLPLWSPWAAIGALPLALLGLRRTQGNLLSVGSVATFFAAAPLALLFLASTKGDVVRNPAWVTFGSKLQFAGAYALFVLLEFGLVGFLVLRLRKPVEAERNWLILILALLALLPIYRYGYSSDLTMRASLPLLFALALLAHRAWVDRGDRWEGKALGALLLLGALSPLHEVTYSVLHYRFGAPEPATIRPLPFTDARHFAVQFLGDESKTFWRFFARR